MTGNGSLMSLPVAVAAVRWWAEPEFHHSNILCFYFEGFRHFLPFCPFLLPFFRRFQLFFTLKCVFFTSGRLRLRHFAGKFPTGRLTKSIQDPSGSTRWLSGTCRTETHRVSTRQRTRYSRILDRSESDGSGVLVILSPDSHRRGGLATPGGES